MNKFSGFAVSLCACAALALPAFAQPRSSAPLLAGETALQYAQRINVCNGSEILSANFEANATRVVVQCSPTGAEGLSGGLGAVAAVGIPLILVVALAGDSSTSTTSSTTSTTSTSGTN